MYTWFLLTISSFSFPRLSKNVTGSGRSNLSRFLPMKNLTRQTIIFTG